MSEDEKLVKIVLEIYPDEEDDEDEGTIETPWATDLGEGLYRLENLPFYAYGIAFHDILECELIEGRLFAEGIHQHSGHSLFRIMLSEGFDFEALKQAWPPFETLGCSFEGATKEFYCIDVPPKVDLAKVVQLLKAGERAGSWEYEEGFLFDPTA